MQEIHDRNKLIDPLTIKYSRFPVEPEVANNNKVTKLRISDWSRQEVMLPILGKNKTSLLHSIEQFDIESIT